MLDGIDDLLKLSYEKGIKNKLITNGKLLTKERIDKIYRYLDSITLSIDSIDENINEQLGRGKNHFSEIETILDYIKLRKYNIKIRINSVACKLNLDSVNNLIPYLNNYNIFSWRIFKFMPLREKAITNKDYFDIDMDEYNSVIKKIKENSNIPNIDTRIQSDMESKYILILADGSIVVTDKGVDKKVGNALKDYIINYI